MEMSTSSEAYIVGQSTNDLVQFVILYSIYTRGNSSNIVGSWGWVSEKKHANMCNPPSTESYLHVCVL